MPAVSKRNCSRISVPDRGAIYQEIRKTYGEIVEHFLCGHASRFILRRVGSSETCEMVNHAQDILVTPTTGSNQKSEVVTMG